MEVPNLSNEPDDDQLRGSIAVVHRDDKFLVIQRAESIRAGGMFCFPGGGIEAGESSKEAVVRELSEELGVVVTPVRELWQSVTAWNVHLTWWLVELPKEFEFIPDPAEVQWVGWMTLEEMKAEPKMLTSNEGFLYALKSGKVTL